MNAQAIIQTMGSIVNRNFPYESVPGIRLSSDSCMMLPFYELFAGTADTKKLFGTRKTGFLYTIGSIYCLRLLFAGQSICDSSAK